MSIISIASDHAGFMLKEEIIPYLKELEYEVIDHGCTSEQKSVDYLDYADKVAQDIIDKKSCYGILICGTGAGMATVANRFGEVRAVVCSNVEVTRLAREHNDANIVCLGARFTETELAKQIVKQFLDTSFSGEIRHKERLKKLNNIVSRRVSTCNKDEISKFARIAHEWWNENGKFKPLHMINPIRVTYIVDKIKQYKLKHTLSVLDVGCGGGILSESMARMGLNVVGIDPCQENIQVAQLHAEKVELDIKYVCTSIEKMSDNKKYDIILLMEVIEHVDDLKFFINKTLRLLKPGGIIFISTINRTIKAFLFAIIGAEYVLRWLPRGTHNWKKFIKPSEIASFLRENNVLLQDMKGIEYSITKCQWQLTENVDVNYIMCARMLKP